MKREDYLQLRLGNRRIEILHQAAKDLSSYNESLYHFSNRFTIWMVPAHIKQLLMERVTEYYDKKFNLILTSYNGVNIKIE